MAPIILLTSISTCTGTVLFFMGMAMVSLWRCFLYPSIIKYNPAESRYTEDLDPSKDEVPHDCSKSNDIDAKAYAQRAQSQAKHEIKGDGAIAKKVFKGDILTITMVGF